MLADMLTMRDHSAKPLERGRLLLPRRRPEQHRELPARDRRPAGPGRPPRAPRGAVAVRRGRRPSPAAGRARRAPDPRHRRRRRGGGGGRLPLHRRLGVDGRASPTGTRGSTSSCPTRSTPSCWRPPAIPTSSSCTASRRCTTPRPRSGARLRQVGPRRARGDRRGLRIAGLDRLRPGREPAAHHQGGHGRHIGD